MKLTATQRQKELLSIVYRHIKDSGYPPSFEEMREALGVSSNQSVIDLLTKLESKKLIRRGSPAARGIVILPLGYQVLGRPALSPFLGLTHAGSPLDAIEIEGDWQAISSELARLNQETFLLKISGDSMINAGIDDGDVVLVKHQKEFASGDIVLALVGSESTIKRFVSEDKPPYLYLKPENPKYEIIYFTEEIELKGKVISVIKKENWQAVN